MVEKHTNNILLARLKSFLDKNRRKLVDRQTSLQDYLENSNSDQVIFKGGKLCMGPVKLHVETQLVKMFTNAGYGRLIQKIIPFTHKEYVTQLQKGENLMTDTAIFTGDSRKLVRAGFRVQQKLSLTRLSLVPSDTDYAIENNLKLSAAASYPDGGKKRDHLDIFKIRVQAQERNLDVNLHKNHSPDNIWSWPIVRGYRLQLREGNDGEINQKLRIMYPYPGTITLLESKFLGPLIEHFKNVDTPYAIGDVGQEIGAKLKRNLDNSKLICSHDAQAYDQSMTNDVIILAFAILRSAFRLTQEQSIIFDNICLYYCSSLCVSKVKGEPAYGFVKLHGIPSGSGFTNMVGSVCHMIMMEYLEPEILDKCIICSDDNIYDATGVDIKMLHKSLKSVFNITIKPEGTDVYKNAKSVFFLGFEWRNYERHISYKLAINQCVYHTAFLLDMEWYDRYVARCASVLLNGKNGKAVFRKLFPSIVNQAEMGIDVRYRFLSGYNPPTKLPSLNIMSEKSEHTENDHSLIYHFKYGYLIR